jgi:hypothetical protein
MKLQAPVMKSLVHPVHSIEGVMEGIRGQGTPLSCSIHCNGEVRAGLDSTADMD